MKWETEALLHFWPNDQKFDSGQNGFQKSIQNTKMTKIQCFWSNRLWGSSKWPKRPKSKWPKEAIQNQSFQRDFWKISEIFKFHHQRFLILQAISSSCTCTTCTSCLDLLKKHRLWLLQRLWTCQNLSKHVVLDMLDDAMSAKWSKTTILDLKKAFCRKKLERTFWPLFQVLPKLTKKFKESKLRRAYLRVLVLGQNHFDGFDKTVKMWFSGLRLQTLHHPTCPKRHVLTGFWPGPKVWSSQSLCFFKRSKHVVHVQHVHDEEMACKMRKRWWWNLKISERFQKSL